MSDKLSANESEVINGTLTVEGHRLLARVYYADTDFSGVVYHARYLEFLERGRTDFLRLKGVHHTALEEGQLGEPIVWIVRRMEIDFRLPARIDDMLVIETSVTEASGARVTMQQRIQRQNGDVLIEARVEAALINKQGRPRRMPAAWKELFTA
ncbi:tol-pal system-associated acyl-CoA thioesterase [Bacillus subtilis]|uniref:tol-pal system-associated acyl-CoA thioesterase n=1 Tax=Pseudochrobactrum asaccharolyticum TaxID=354351 RepID=UPI000EFADEDF|nr:tol-pal system-associated acyl-CoA thioesterase [Pseudochrobactrum asaccharolyticum]MBX8801754.1 tol-pal system-associated acyl-CoA thioesterase [Ochrobactrum sp. MR28]MBX8816737.1 tol-pal system-associated acyl-CoA thioesterase [Ochrobactrum sp. MR31]MCF7646237.1 tol-pal system-associated acyl-CoA thioesterase [Pseudochrobactrum asaccharolyticum]MCF7672984.1 tol-pal system-associated acyl-CoA thioesterase [Bacillus subtilis]